MADRSTFPNSVEADEGDFRFESESRIFHTLDKFAALGVMGVKSGLALSVNGADAARFDLSAGEGYARGGELVVVSSALVGSALASTTAGSRTYVVAFYDEVGARPGRPALGGTSQDRRAVRASRVEVLSEAAWQALIPSAADLSVNALDRACLVGVIVAPATVGGALTTASFLQVRVFDRILTLAPLVNVTGLVPTRIDPAMPLSESQVTNPSARIEVDFNTPVYRARLRGPGSATFGDWVTVTAGGAFVLWSLPAAAGFFVNVTVNAALLPVIATGTSVTDDVAVSALYEGSFGTMRLSANDATHRSNLGSSLPTATNPHGLAPGDLERDATFRSIVVGMGFADTAAQNNLPRAIFVGGGTGNYVFEELSTIGGTLIRRRLYRELGTGARIETLNALWSNVANTWSKDVNGQGASLTRQIGSIFQVWTMRSADNAPWTDWRQDVSLGETSTFTNLSPSPPLTLRAATDPRLTMNFPVTGAGSRVCIWESSPLDGSLTGARLRWWRALVATGASNSAGASELTFNANWNGSNWARDDAAVSLKYEYGDVNHVTILSRITNAAPWGDGSWESNPFRLEENGVIEVIGPVSVDQEVIAQDFFYSPVLAVTKYISGASARIPEAAINGLGTGGARVVITLTDPLAAGGYLEFVSGSSNKGAMYHLDVPTGAVITGVILRGVFGPVTQTLRAAVVREAIDGTLALLAAGGYDTLATSSGSPASRSLTIDQNASVDRTAYSYYVWLGCSAASSDATMTIFQVILSYTLSIVPT